MAVSPYRVSYFWYLKNRLHAGWSENFWILKESPEQVLAAAEDLRQELKLIHGAQTLNQAIRISDPATFRKVALKVYSDVASTVITGGSVSDLAPVAALGVLHAGADLLVRQWFRGVKDNDVDQVGLWKPNADTVQGLARMKAQLALQGWVLRKLDPAVVPINVTAISQAGIVTLEAALAPGAIRRIRLSRFISNIDINRVWKFTPIDSTHIQLLGPVPFTVAPVFVQVGTARLQSYAYFAITNLEIERATTHKTGRPSGQSSGRRRTRRRAGAGLPVVV